MVCRRQSNLRGQVFCIIIHIFATFYQERSRRLIWLYILLIINENYNILHNLFVSLYYLAIYMIKNEEPKLFWRSLAFKQTITEGNTLWSTNTFRDLHVTITNIHLVHYIVDVTTSVQTSKRWRESCIGVIIYGRIGVLDKEDVDPIFGMIDRVCQDLAGGVKWQLVSRGT